VVIIIMGVSGCGKTTVGQMLAKAQGWAFLDADDFHSSANKAKMQAGIPLQDADRADWLASLGEALAKRQRAGVSVVMACSALKQAYRDRLAQAVPFSLVYLFGSQDLIAQRLQNRPGHFMNPALLDSQFAILEAPDDALHIPVELPVAEAVARIQLALAAAPRSTRPLTRP